MTNKEILEKAITKAIDGGWFALPSGKSIKKINVVSYRYDDLQSPKIWIVPVGLSDGSGFVIKQEYHFFYDHQFAKALWGNDQLGVNYSDLMPDDSDVFYEGCTDGIGYEMPAWRHHLQQMVIADDPIKYLGENI